MSNYFYTEPINVGSVYLIQKERENLFVLLRTYHEGPVPEGPAEGVVSGLLADLEKVQDKVISMALGVFGGKNDFVDWLPDLKTFAMKVKVQTKEAKLEQSEGDLISAKVTLLQEVVDFTRRASLVAAV